MTSKFELIKILQEIYIRSDETAIEFEEFNFDGKTYNLEYSADERYSTLVVEKDNHKFGVLYNDHFKRFLIFDDLNVRRLAYLNFDIKKNIQDHDDTELLLLLGKRYTDESLIAFMFGE